MRAVVLLSGGLDSYTAAAIAKSEGFELCALTIWYGQRHEREVESARAVARALGDRASSRAADRPARHRRIVADLGRERARATAICRRPTFRPPTCRRATPSFCRWRSAGPKCSRRPTSSSASTRSTIRAIPTAGRSSSARSNRWRRWRRAPASKAARFRIHTPLIDLTKAEIIRRGLALGLDYGLTHSCYDPQSDGRPCGRCDSCALRARGFAEAGVADPLVLG